MRFDWRRRHEVNALNLVELSHGQCDNQYPNACCVLERWGCDSITGTQVQLADSGAEQVRKGKQEVQSAIDRASSTKRRISKPTYLRDYV